MIAFPEFVVYDRMSMVIEEHSDRFSQEWLKYYAIQYGPRKVYLSMDENGRMAIIVNED